MTKNLHTKILFIILLCVVVVLVAFACAPKTSTILSNPPDDGGGGGGSGSRIDVNGGEKSESSVSEFFSYLKEALAVDDASDNVAFKFVSEDMTVVESGKTFDMYAEFVCKYDRRDDSKTELLFEIHSSHTRDLVYGLYYLNGTIYMNVPNEQGGVTIYMDEFSLRDILTIATNAADAISGGYESVMNTQIPMLGSVGGLISPVLDSAVKSVTKTVKDDATQLVLKTDFNAAINKLFGVLRNAKAALENYQVDTILSSVFGVSLTTIMNYTFEQFTCDVTLNIKGGKLVSIEPTLGYGTSNFALDLTIDNQYYGDDTNMVGAITFPEFNDYRKFGVTNMEFTLRVDLENGSEKQVTVDNLIGGVLKEFFGLDSLGALGERTLTLGKGTIGLLLDVNAELDWNKNERNYLEVEIYERLTSGKKLLGTVYYVGTKNALYVDFSASKLPKFVYEGLNLASVLKSMVVQTLASVFGTAEGNSAAGEEMRSLVIDTFAPGGTYEQALSNIVQHGTYEYVSEAGDGRSYAKLDVFSLVISLIKTLERRPSGRRAIAVTLDRPMLLSIIEGLARDAKDDLDKVVDNQSKDETLKTINTNITTTQSQITAKTAEKASIEASLADARNNGSLDLVDRLERELATAETALTQLNVQLADYLELKAAREKELATALKSAQDKFDLFASIHDGVNATLSSSDVAIREIRVELGLLSGGFGIYLDVNAKLSEDTNLIIAVDRLSIGYAPTFNVPKDRFDGSGYSTLEEFSAVSVSAQISLGGDTGSLQSVNLGDALGGVIGELTCLLGVKQPLSGGLDIKVDANIIFDPISISEYLGGANVKLELSNIELAVNVYKKPSATTSDMTEDNRLLTVWYGEYVSGQSAIFVDATGISISEDGTTIPRFMYRIRLEDLFSGALAAEDYKDNGVEHRRFDAALCGIRAVGRDMAAHFPDEKVAQAGIRQAQLRL